LAHLNEFMILSQSVYENIAYANVLKKYFLIIQDLVEGKLQVKLDSAAFLRNWDGKF